MRAETPLKLGTCLPTDESAQIDGHFNIEKALAAVRSAGIKGCLTNFPGDESVWRTHSHRLKNALRDTGVKLLEYNLPFFISAASSDNRASEAERTVRLLELAEETGCLNVGTCLANKQSILFDSESRSQKYYDNARATCELIARKAEKRGLKARLQIELVYTTVTWKPAKLVQLLDDIASSNVQGHMDIANCFTFDHLYNQAVFIRESFRAFRDRPFCSAHLKDILPLAESYFPGLYEVLVGDGAMDIPTYLQCLNEVSPDMPVLIEHMHRMDDIKRSYERTCQMARAIGVEVWNS